jgi:tryptophan-rich sensory protein
MSPETMGKFMNRNVKNILMGIVVVLLTAFLVVMELSLRIVRHVSPTADRYIQGLFQSHPIIFGFLWLVIMISGVSVAYIKFSKQKTAGRLAALIVWLTTFVGILLYGLYQVL